MPLENVSQINFKSKHYYSKNLRELAALLLNTEIFIGADSGMMHLASASGTKTVGLFSVTKPEKYEPYGNNSFSIFTPNYNILEILDQIQH